MIGASDRQYEKDATTNSVRLTHLDDAFKQKKRSK